MECEKCVKLAKQIEELIHTNRNLNQVNQLAMDIIEELEDDNKRGCSVSGRTIEARSGLPGWFR